MWELWLIVPIALFAALASASYPDYSQVITSIVIPVATIINLVVWIRTTMKRASRRKH
ncbi:MAG: hypothetical protein U0787_22165 [Polyangia bacterium]